jgi:hypothetical protein
MVKLDSWNEINKALFRRHLPSVISAKELKVFRMIERVFSGQDKEGEVHQCACGDIFYLGKSVRDKVPRDWLGNPKCPKCADSPESYKDKEWRRKFAIFANITNALRCFEESEGEQKIKWLKEVRRLSKGFFHFGTVSEMYVGYYKLLKEVQSEEDIPSSLKVEWKNLWSSSSLSSLLTHFRLDKYAILLVNRRLPLHVWKKTTFSPKFQIVPNWSFL